MDDLYRRVPPSVPGVVRCLKCDHDFSSPDRKSVRICGRCKREQERFGLLAERFSSVGGMDIQTGSRPIYGSSDFPIPPPSPLLKRLKADAKKQEQKQIRKQQTVAARLAGPSPWRTKAVKLAKPAKPDLLLPPAIEDDDLFV